MLIKVDKQPSRLSGFKAFTFSCRVTPSPHTNLHGESTHDYWVIRDVFEEMYIAFSPHSDLCSFKDIGRLF